MTMREMGAPVDQKIIDRAIKYLTDSLPNTEDNLQKVEIFLTLAKAGKGKDVYNKYYSQLDITPNLNLHEKITYLDALVSTDAKLYSYQIQQLIIKIQKEFRNPNNSDGYYWYWNTDSDKANFVDILMRLNYERATVLSFIQELSERDYDSYFVSTQVKNSVFMSFLRYMQTYTNNQKQSVQFTLQ